MNKLRDKRDSNKDEYYAKVKEYDDRLTEIRGEIQTERNRVKNPSQTFIKEAEEAKRRVSDRYNV